MMKGRVDIELLTNCFETYSKNITSNCRSNF